MKPIDCVGLRKVMTLAFAGVLAASVGLAESGCSNTSQSGGLVAGDSESKQSANLATSGTYDLSGLDLEFTDRDMDDSYDSASATKIFLQGETVQIEGGGASADKGIVTISTEGTYIVSGVLNEGQLLISASDTDKLQVVMEGASIHNSSGPALYIDNADKVFITLAEGFDNELSDGSEYVLEDEDDNRDATLFSRDDLTINGSGSLIINGNYNHAIVSKDDLVITGGTFTVSAVEDAFQGKDAIKIADGDFTVNVGDDAFHSEYLFYAKGGSIDVQSCYEGYEAEKIIIDGGEHNIVASDDAINAAVADSEETSESGNTNVEINGLDKLEKASGLEDDISVPLDDKRDFGAEAPDGSGRADIQGGPAFGEDGMGEPPQSSQEGTPPALPEGMDATNAQEERVNMRGDEDFQNDQRPDDVRGGFGGGGIGTMGQMAESSEDCLIQINGGTVFATGANDAIDSNGNVEINGGTVFANGPSNGMDGCLDYDLNAQINGGIVLMVGSVGSTKGLDQSAQAWTVLSQHGSAGKELSIVSADGTVLASMVPTVDYSSIFVSCPNLPDDISAI